MIQAHMAGKLCIVLSSPKKSFNLRIYFIHQLKNLYHLIAKQSIFNMGLLWPNFGRHLPGKWFLGPLEALFEWQYSNLFVQSHIFPFSIFDWP